jgi:glycosyltransferase 2 family protein
MTSLTTSRVGVPATAGRLARARLPRWRLLGVVLLVAPLVWWSGLGPFAEGLRDARPWALGAALLLTAGTTWCCALRWSLVARRFDERVPMRAAYPAYYRAQLVNVGVPGGVVGDLHRGWRFGWRPVLWERGIGQVVQVGLAATLVLPAGWRWAGGLALLAALAVGGSVVLLSLLSTGGHLAVFLVAAVAAGAHLPVSTLLPVGALVLVGASLPLNLAGWGPREGVAALAFTTYGADARLGLGVAVTFGVLSTAATLPGLLALRGPAGGRGGGGG